MGRGGFAAEGRLVAQAAGWQFGSTVAVEGLDGAVLLSLQKWIACANGERRSWHMPSYASPHTHNLMDAN